MANGEWRERVWEYGQVREQMRHVAQREVWLRRDVEAALFSR